MKKNNTFVGLNNMIREKLEVNEKFGIGVKEDLGCFEFVYGEILYGLIMNPVVLPNVNRETICQDLYDNLMNEFGDKISTGYTHSFAGDYEYFMTIDGIVTIMYPDGLDYRRWIYNRVQKDRELTNKKNKVKQK